ncbi:MAG: tetratricopeptide repeat-containing serine protease family protein [Xenococcus sp. (in: cyanobacteria)]
MKYALHIIASLILLPILVISDDYQLLLQHPDYPDLFLKGWKNKNWEQPEIIAQIDDPQLLEFATNITVKVTTDRTSGSGVIFGKNNNTYLVLSSGHVIRDSKSITIRTVDGLIHQASLIPIDKDLDLALLEFTSENTYEIASLNYNYFPRIEEKILAVGYSSETGELVNINGQITQIPEKKLKLGYQIGFTGDLVPGMSGGAVVIADEYGGDLIGINGIGTYPILNTGYTYQDGINPSPTEIESMREVSWGIPIYTLLKQIDTQIMTAYNIDPPSTVAEIENIPLTGWLGELEQKARAVTVRIDNTNGLNNGSGIIVAREDNVYAVLTVDHIICEQVDAQNHCKDFTYEIVAPNGQRYPIERNDIKRVKGVDLAIIRFSSDQNYQIAEFADYSVKNNDQVFVAGYPRLSQTRSPKWLFSLGYSLEKEQGLSKVQDSSITQDSFSVVSSKASLAGGYELVYTSITYGGMSGGAVFDREGRVIGIHGLAEGEYVIEESSGNFKRIQLGYSLGIPINSFLALQKKFDLKQLQTQNTPVQVFNRRDKNDFETAILNVEIPQGNAETYQWLQRGNQLWRLKRYQEAVQVFDKAIALDPEFNYLAYYGKGLALWDQRANREALESLEQATIANPNFAPAFLAKSAVLSNLNQLESALVAINKAIALQVNNAYLYHQKGDILSNLKRYGEAKRAYNQAREKSPGYSNYIFSEQFWF